MTTTGRATAPTLPDLQWFETYYGVQISCIGDAGDMVMLGHIPPRRAIAVVRAYLRRLLGVQAEVDDQLGSRLGRDPADRKRAADRGIADVHAPGVHRWAVLLRCCTRWPVCRNTGEHCGEPASCEEIASYPWWISTDDVDADTPDAFPITYWYE